MGMLTDEQRNGLRHFLERQGLSFKPLQDEMMDHLGCDLEERMSEGLSFQEAWDQSIREIPNNHFQLIQQEIMETINKRVSWSRVLSFFALGLILISAVFKALHLQFGGVVLLMSFGCMAAALLTGSLSGIRLNKGKKGATRVLAVTVGIILLMIGFSFKFLHLRGGDQLIILAVAVLIISLVVNSLYVYKHASGEGTLLTYLHEKYTPGIERFLMLLLFPLVIYKGFIIMGTVDFLGNFLLLIVILGGGIQFIVLTWRMMEKEPAKRNVVILTATIVCCSCLIFPFLGPLLPLPVRVILITLFSPVAGWLAYTMEENSRKGIDAFLVVLVTAAFLGWALIHLSVIPSSATWIFFNIPVLLLLVAGILLSKKHGTMRAFMLVSVAGYLFEYVSI